MLAPLIVVSCFTVATAPHEGHGGGGVDLVVLSGIERPNPTTPSPTFRGAARWQARIAVPMHGCVATALPHLGAARERGGSTFGPP